MSEASFRPVSASVTILKELLVPAYANFGGKVHGGVILNLMDKIAYTAAATHARTYCVTAAINQVDFLNSVDVGDLLTLHASVNYVQSSSMEVGIRVESMNFREGTMKHTNTSYFTMVAMNDGAAKAIVPGLLLETRDDVRRFIEGRVRRGNQRLQRETLRELRQHSDLGAEVDALQDAACQLREGLRAQLQLLP